MQCNVKRSWLHICVSSYLFFNRVNHFLAPFCFVYTQSNYHSRGSVENNYCCNFCFSIIISLYARSIETSKINCFSFLRISIPKRIIIS